MFTNELRNLEPRRCNPCAQRKDNLEVVRDIRKDLFDINRDLREIEKNRVCEGIRDIQEGVRDIEEGVADITSVLQHLFL